MSHNLEAFKQGLKMLTKSTEAQSHTHTHSQSWRDSWHFPSPKSFSPQHSSSFDFTHGQPYLFIYCTQLYENL